MQILLAALSSGPRMVMYGLIDVCKSVCPTPPIKRAKRNNGKLVVLADGTNRIIPMAITMNDKTIPPL